MFCSHYKLKSNNGIYEITMTITEDMVASGNNLTYNTAGAYRISLGCCDCHPGSGLFLRCLFI